MSFLETLENYLSKTLIPIAKKIEANSQLTGIRKGLMALISISVIGAIPSIFYALGDMSAVFFHSEAMANGLKQISTILNPIYTFTTGILSLYVAALIGFYYAKERKVWDLGAMILSLSSFLILSANMPVADFQFGGQSVEESILTLGWTTSWLDGKGMFTAIIAALVSVDIMYIFNKYKITINLGDGVPGPVAKSFEILYAMITTLALAAVASYLVQKTSGMLVPQLIEKVLAPFTSTVNTWWMVVILVFLQQLLWWFGIHGYSVTAAIWLPISMSNTQANAALVEAGKQAQYVLTYSFWNDIIVVTGSGITGGLVLLALFSKSKRFKALGKLSLVPGIFSINEPVTFGVPLFLNPVMFIPFTIGNTILAGLAYFAVSSGFVGKAIMVAPNMPVPFSGYLATGFDFNYIIFFIGFMVLSTLMYLPFFKILEKQALEEEKEAEKQLSLDDVLSDDLFDII